MKAKLIKTEGSYILKDGLLQVIGIDDENLKERLNCNYLLSTKNCQAIENGYDLDDLDELAKSVPHTCRNDEDWYKCRAGFIVGFQKALELMGDKKFTEEDVRNAVYEGVKIGRGTPFVVPATDDYLKSLQQNEWEVEMIMECTQCQSYGYVSECRDNCNKKFLQPKLNADGCLILKRVV